MFSRSSSSKVAATYSKSSAFDYDDWAASASSNDTSFTTRRRDIARVLVQTIRRSNSSLAIVVVCVLFVSGFLGYAALALYSRSKGWAVYLDPEAHKRASIMRLSPPFDRLRDVVFDQPIRKSDVLFFWQTRETGEDIFPDMLTECFGLTLAYSPSRQWQKEPELRVHRFNGRNYINIDTTTLEGIQRAKDLKLTSSDITGVVIVSPFIREVSDIMTEDNFGRIFAFFRHPIERELERGKNGKFEDNFLTRFIINKPEGELNFVDLGQAKIIIWEKVVVGLLDENLDESVNRMVAYFGWKGSEVCVENYVDKLPREKLGDLVDGTDATWRLLEPYNMFDIQLYEHARSVFRSQKQTIVSLQKQLELSVGDSEEEEEGQ